MPFTIVHMPVPALTPLQVGLLCGALTALGWGSGDIYLAHHLHRIGGTPLRTLCATSLAATLVLLVALPTSGTLALLLANPPALSLVALASAFGLLLLAGNVCLYS